MVFHQTSKHKRHGRKSKTKTGITDIPDDLKLLIFNHLPTPDILRLRLAHPSFTPACTTELNTRLQRVYIHPATSSLRAAVDICDHPILGQAIEEVVLLGEVLWRDIERVYPSVRSADEQNYSRDPGHKCRFRPWPYTCPPPKGTVTGSTNYGRSTFAHSVTFEDAYRPLINGLAKLPCLRKITFAEYVDMPGFNAVTEAVITAHARKISEVPPPRAKMAQSDIDSLGMVGRVTRWSDAGVFFGLLTHSKLNFSQAALTVELPFVSEWDMKLSNSPERQQKLAYLTHLELHLDRGWCQTVWHGLCRTVLLSAVELEHLRVCFRPNTSIKRVKSESALAYILRDDTESPQERLPQLKTLELISLEPEDGIRAPRAPCHSLDIPTFLLERADTLERITFTNMLFAASSANYSAVLSVGTTLEAVLACKKLKDIVWTVDRFAHDSRCKRQDDQSMVGCKFDCGVYSGIAHRMAKLEDVEALAAELDVQLVKTGRFWDFGEYVRRQWASDEKTE